MKKGMEKEFKRFIVIDEIWTRTARAESESRLIRIRSAIKGVLESCGKNGPNELLDAAAEFVMKNKIMPPLTPKREGWWFIDMLCCFCDGKEFNIKEYKKDNV